MEQKIKEIIMKEFNAETFDIQKINVGYSHNMFDVKIGWPLRNVIIRFANNSGKEFNLAKEKFVINLLKEKNLPVPKILAFHAEEDEKNNYMILEKLSGIRLDTIWDDLQKNEKIQITKEIGILLAKIHEIKLEDFGYIMAEGKIKFESEFEFKQAGEKPPFSKYIRQNLHDSFKDLARLISHKTVSPEFISKYMEYITKNIENIEYKGEPTMTHGDYVHGHLFVKKEDGNYKISGLIDFEFAKAYDPSYDFIKLHRTGFFDDSEIKQALKEGYGEINEKSIEMHRLMRDFGFAQVLYQSGDQKLAFEIFNKIGKKIGAEFTLIS